MSYLDGVPSLPDDLLTIVDPRRRVHKDKLAAAELALTEELLWLKWLIRIRRAAWEAENHTSVPIDPPTLPTEDDTPYEPQPSLPPAS